MIMVIGGACENKVQTVVKLFSVDPSEIVDGRKCNLEEVMKSRCISNFHFLIKRIFELGKDTDEFVKRFCNQNSKAIIIMDEIGCGVVPIKKNDRKMREAVGRAGCIIAENSQYAVRVCCGINTFIKGNNYEN